MVHRDKMDSLDYLDLRVHLGMRAKMGLLENKAPMGQLALLAIEGQLVHRDPVVFKDFQELLAPLVLRVKMATLVCRVIQV